MKRFLLAVVLALLCVSARAQVPGPSDIPPQVAAASLGVLNATVIMPLTGQKNVVVDIQGPFVATNAFEATVNGATWFGIWGIPATSSSAGAPTNGAVAPGQWILPTAGYAQVRVRLSAYSSGTSVVTMRTAPSASYAMVAVQGNPVMGAGTNVVGDVGVQYRNNATGAALSSSILSPATAAAASIKASAGRVVGYCLNNSASAVRSVKLFNATSVTLGTTAALFEVDLPASATVCVALDGGAAFTTGVMWAVTAAKGLTDNTSTGLAANDVSGVVWYQ